MTRIVTGAGYGVEMLEFIDSLREEFDGSVTSQTSTSFVIDVGDGYTITIQGSGFTNYFGDNPPLSGTVTGFTFKDGSTNVAVVSEMSVPISTLIGFVLEDDGDGFRDAVLGGADFIYGASDDDVLRGYGGSDSLYGGGGDDVYYIENAGDKAYEAKDKGTDAVISSVSYSLSGQYIESLTLTGSGNINATGNTQTNMLTGNSGKNTLDGGAGADTMAGGAGNDTYYVDSRGDVVVEAKNQGTDTVISSISFTLLSGVYVENLTLSGSSNINATGNGIANALRGNSGNNVLNGGAGADTMTGGKGNDTYIVDNKGDKAIEAKSQGTDWVYSSVDYSLKGQYVEYLTLTGTADVYAKGNTLDNRLVDNTGDNRINGMEGQDRLTGGGGSDTFIWDKTSHSKVNDSDRITDLSSNDFIDLSRIDANVNAQGTQHFVLVDQFTHTAGQVMLHFDGTYTNLTADTNGDGVADMLVRIDGNHEDFDHFIFGG